MIDSPNPGTFYNYLYAVTSISATDVWAVGNYSSGQGSFTLTMHWDGSVWSMLPSPSPGTVGSGLTAVSAVSANDVWAVGGYNNGIVGMPLTMHWDGSAWTEVPLPDSSIPGHLRGVSMASSSDGWAVGSYGTSVAAILHWDGSAWSLVPSPNPGTLSNLLFGVDAVSANDAWAVGSFESSPSNRQPLALHWDGSEWSVSPTPNLPPHGDLHAVEALSASDVWAVGFYGYADATRALAMHWDGNAWSLAHVPGLAAFDKLIALDMTSWDDGWALGVVYDNLGVRYHVIHWDGSIWNAVPAPNLGADDRVYGLSFAPASDGWVVGDHRTELEPPETLTLHYSPCPLVPTATPTACPVQFSDVPAGHTFYAFIRCLACREVVSGYADGTFHPEYAVTRGQIAKIVSNSVGFDEGHSNQTFADIPPSHTFYIYVERLAARSIVGGYACGGVGEPCPGTYFRANSNATRGQIAKIVCQAYVCVEGSTGQRFEDVPPGHTFYTDIERLYGLGAIDGYPCGQPEPCVPPGNRPYFRPGNSVTRGQTAKIVSNVFFPGCYTPARR